MSAPAALGTGPLETVLRARVAAGRKLLVPYLVAGAGEDWTEHLRALAAAGADAVEVGLPFSDPVLDGPVITAAQEYSLARGTTVSSALAELARLDVGVPLVAMTYANLALGSPGFCPALRAAGVGGLIVPDVPEQESAELSQACAAAGVDSVLLAAPSTPPARRAAIAARSRGFVYAASVMGTTGEREDLPPEAVRLAADLRALTDTPVLLGLGISSPAQAERAAQVADGVVVGSAVVRRIGDGASPAELGRWLGGLRAALDAA